MGTFSHPSAASWLGVLAVVVSAALGAGVVAWAKPAAAAPPGEPAQAYTALVSQADAMAERLQRVTQKHEALRASLSRVPDASPKEKADALRRNHELAARLAQLEAVLRKLAAAHGNDASAASLRDKLAEARKRLDDLVKQQAAAGAEQGADANGFIRQAFPDTKPLMGIWLVKNRVVPVTKDYFSGRLEQRRLSDSGRIVPVAVISRVGDGEPAADAVKPGGMLDKLLATTATKEGFISVAVCADSIAALRLVAPYLARRGLAYAWDTAKDQTIVQRLDDTGGGSDAGPWISRHR